MKRILAAAAAISAAALIVVAAVAAAGSGTSTAPKTSPATNYGGEAAIPPARASRAVTIGVRRTSHGSTLVDGQGRTLYLFEADKRNISNCTSSCLAVWPALTTRTTPHATAGAVGAKIGTIRSRGGTRQVTYAGHPLYRYVGDHKPGDTAGQGLNQFGAKWYVLSPSGRKIDDD